MKGDESRPLRLVFRPLKMEGRVLDGANRPISGVKISFQERQIAVSDIRGRFVMVVYDPVEMAAVTFEAAGFAPLTRCWRRDEFGGRRVQVVMPNTAHVATFQCGIPQRFKLGPLRLRLLGGAVVDAQGCPYTAAAQMHLTPSHAPVRPPYPGAQVLVGFQLGITDGNGDTLHMQSEASDSMTLVWPGEEGMQLFKMGLDEGRWILVAQGVDIGAGKSKAFRMAAGTGSYLLTMPDKPCLQVEAKALDAMTGSPLEGILVCARSHDMEQRQVTQWDGKVWLSCPADAPMFIHASGEVMGRPYLLPSTITYESRHHLAACSVGGILRPLAPGIRLEMRSHSSVGPWLTWKNTPGQQ